MKGWFPALGVCLFLGGCASTPQPGSLAPKRARDVQKTMKKADNALRDARLTDAETLYRRLSKTHPGAPEVWLRLGNVYMREGQLQAAVHTYTQGLHYSRKDGRLWYNLSLARLKQAIDTLETSSRVLPSNNHYRPRIRALHRALLGAGQS